MARRASRSGRRPKLTGSAGRSEAELPTPAELPPGLVIREVEPARFVSEEFLEVARDLGTSNAAMKLLTPSASDDAEVAESATA